MNPLMLKLLDLEIIEFIEKKSKAKIKPFMADTEKVKIAIVKNPTTTILKIICDFNIDLSVIFAQSYTKL